MKILIIEDEHEIARPLQRALTREGFVVEHEETGMAGFKAAQINEYDCILLDLNLPEMDGVEVCQKLRNEEVFTPIIMLTARGTQGDKVTGLDIGADDYVTKPFDYQELLSRIKAAIRRNSNNKNTELKIGDFLFDPEKNSAVRGNEEIQLSNKEAGVLEYLLRNSDRYVSAEELLEHVWDTEIDVFTETVKTHIKTLRRKVDPDKKYIKTMRGKGYMVD